MPQVKPAIETFAKIKVVGVGGSGGSAINRMMAAKIRGVDFIAMNTDAQDLHHSLAPQKLHIGKSVTRGLGAGMDPELGRRSAEEAQNEIREILKDADMVFITCGLGGGTGTGASPIVAEVARELGALTVAVVTKPFAFEGAKRREVADKGWDNLVKHVDTIITIPNDRINQLIDKKTTMLDAFKFADNVLQQGVQGISELITLHGLINVDFADVKTIMKDTGSALMGIGTGKGENRAIDAAKAAISSPLLELSIDGARGILFTVTGGPDMAMSEVEEAAKLITASVAEDARVIFGAIIDETMGGSMRISVIATGFDDRRAINEDDSISRYSPFGTVNLASKFKQREEENEQKKFLDEVVNTKISQFGRQAAVSEPAREYKKEAPNNAAQAANAAVSDDDLEIPAFIRRKMGV
jgi:cell division protein FtsZ